MEKKSFECLNDEICFKRSMRNVFFFALNEQKVQARKLKEQPTVLQLRYLCLFGLLWYNSVSSCTGAASACKEAARKL